MEKTNIHVYKNNKKKTSKKINKTKNKKKGAFPQKTLRKQVINDVSPIPGLCS